MPVQIKKRRRLTDQELGTVKQNLLDRKKMLFEEIREDIEEDAREEYQDLLQSLRDPGDKAMAELEEAKIFSYVKLKVKEIESIDQALEQIMTGKYGRCRDCSRWIRPARLMVMPYAVRCRACQEKLEKLDGI